MLKMQEVARNYLRQGLNVIPVISEQKKPAVSWMEFNDRQANPIEIQSWFAGKQTNIGIVTGKISKIVVIDIDKPELFDTFIKRYPTHRIQRTASGGYHLLYAYEGEDIGNSVSRLASGIDVRGNHGYIVTYPSTIRLANGTLGAYHWQEEGVIAPLPIELHDTIVNELRKQKPDTTGIQQDDAKDLFYNVLVNGFTSGRHNEEVKDIGRYLYRTGMEQDAIINLLSALNMKDATPLSPSELLATINSGIKYEQKRLGQKTGKADGRVFDAISSIDLGVAYDGQINSYLIEDWIPRNSIMVITAPPESYKTWIALEAAVQIALGSNSTGFLGGQWQGPTIPEPVLIVQQEDHKAKLWERFETILKTKAANAEYMVLQDAKGTPFFETVWDLPLHWHTLAMLNFDEPETVQALEKKIKEHGIKFVVIDPLYSLASSDDFFASMARKMLPIKELRDKYGVTFLFVHHNKKGTKGAKNVDDMEREGMFGSQLLNGAFEGILLLNTLTNGSKVIKRVGKAFDGKKEAFKIEFDISTHWTFDEATQEGEPSHYTVRLSKADDNPFDSETEAMRDALADMIEGTINAVATAAGVKGNRDKIKKKFETLINLGIAVPKEPVRRDGKGQIYEFAAVS